MGWGGSFVPHPHAPQNTHTKQNVLTHLPNLRYATGTSIYDRTSFFLPQVERVEAGGCGPLLRLVEECQSGAHEDVVTVQLPQCDLNVVEHSPMMPNKVRANVASVRKLYNFYFCKLLEEQLSCTSNCLCPSAMFIVIWPSEWYFTCDKVSMLTHTYPHKPPRKSEVTLCNHQADSPLYDCVA